MTFVATRAIAALAIALHHWLLSILTLEQSITEHYFGRKNGWNAMGQISPWPASPLTVRTKVTVRRFLSEI